MPQNQCHDVKPFHYSFGLKKLEQNQVKLMSYGLEFIS